jgi:hypothetical protein
MAISSIADTRDSSAPDSDINGEELYDWQRQLEHQQQRLRVHHEQLQWQQQAQHLQRRQLAHQQQLQQQTHTEQRPSVPQQFGQGGAMPSTISASPPTDGTRDVSGALEGSAGSGRQRGESTVVRYRAQQQGSGCVKEEQEEQDPQTEDDPKDMNVRRTVCRVDENGCRIDRNGRKHRGGRRRKEDYMNVASTYEELYTRVMDIVSAGAEPTKFLFKRRFADKELRVIMGMNKILINDFMPDGNYKEMTKDGKLDALMPRILARDLVEPDTLKASIYRSVVKDLSPNAKPKPGGEMVLAIDDVNSHEVAPFLWNIQTKRRSRGPNKNRQPKRQKTGDGDRGQEHAPLNQPQMQMQLQQQMRIRQMQTQMQPQGHQQALQQSQQPLLLQHQRAQRQRQQQRQQAQHSLLRQQAQQQQRQRQQAQQQQAQQQQRQHAQQHQHQHQHQHQQQEAQQTQMQQWQIQQWHHRLEWQPPRPPFLRSVSSSTGAATAAPPAPPPSNDSFDVIV